MWTSSCAYFTHSQLCGLLPFSLSLSLSLSLSCPSPFSLCAFPSLPLCLPFLLPLALQSGKGWLFGHCKTQQDCSRVAQFVMRKYVVMECDGIQSLPFVIVVFVPTTLDVMLVMEVVQKAIVKCEVCVSSPWNKYCDGWHRALSICMIAYMWPLSCPLGSMSVVWMKSLLISGEICPYPF